MTAVMKTDVAVRTALYRIVARFCREDRHGS
jgi:hypothetical protein